MASAMGHGGNFAQHHGGTKCYVGSIVGVWARSPGAPAKIIVPPRN